MTISSASVGRRPIRRLSFLCLVIASALVLAGCGGGGGATSTVTLPPLGTNALSSGSTTTRATSATVTTLSPSTTRGRACDTHPGVKCINIRSITTSGNALVIEWDAINFTPSLQSFHAHFFWDTVSPKSAGTNAAKFGATVGTWELTDKQPFVSAGELSLSNRPAAAKQVCVEVADVAHALVDPTVFDCIALPS